MDGAVPSMRRRLVGALGSTRGPATGPAWTPALPPGRLLGLPGRGAVFVREHRPAAATGPPVLLLHGWTWSLDVNYFAVMPALAAAGIPFIGFDQRGHGRGLPAGRPFGIGDLAVDAVAVLDRLGVAEAVVCGYSLGGPVGLHLALAHPDRVAGLVLAGAALGYRQSVRDRTVWRLLAAAAPLARLGVGSSMPARYFGGAGALRPTSRGGGRGCAKNSRAPPSGERWRRAGPSAATTCEAGFRPFATCRPPSSSPRATRCAHRTGNDSCPASSAPAPSNYRTITTSRSPGRTPSPPRC